MLDTSTSTVDGATIIEVRVDRRLTERRSNPYGPPSSAEEERQPVASALDQIASRYGRNFLRVGTPAATVHRMKFAVIQFPGSNCDQDCVAGINGLDGLRAEYVWHKETSLDDYDAIVLPGGFAYGDYLRCGAIARFSPVMGAVISDARAGKLVLGTCNGFQILCEAGLLPGALVRNRSLRFVCDMVITRVEVDDSSFTHGCPKGTLLRLPVAHGEGCFYADAETLRQLNANEQVILRYADRKGRIVPEANPNGSIENIAGICNRERNVFGLMPHPDRASDARLGSADGAKIFRSMMQTVSAAASHSTGILRVTNSNPLDAEATSAVA